MLASLVSNFTLTAEKEGCTALESCFLTYFKNINLMMLLLVLENLFSIGYLVRNDKLSISRACTCHSSYKMSFDKIGKYKKKIVNNLIWNLEGVGPTPKVNSLALSELRLIISSKYSGWLACPSTIVNTIYS